MVSSGDIPIDCYMTANVPGHAVALKSMLSMCATKLCVKFLL